MISTTRKRRLILQGFTGLDDAALHEIAPWARLAPGTCAALTLFGVWLGQTWWFYALAGVALIGAVTGRHPIDFAYNEVLAPILGTRRLPRCGAARRFAFSIGTLWLVATALAFQNGPSLTGGILAGLIAAGMFMSATLDFCAPCWVFDLLFATKKRHTYRSMADEPTMLMTRPSAPAA